MKKTGWLVLILALLLGLTACGGSGNQETAGAGTEKESTGAPTEQAPTETEVKEAAFFAGFGRADITPTDSVPMVGYGDENKRKSVGFLDPIYANCVALQDETGETVILVVLDLVGLWDSQVESVKQAVMKTTGVAKDHVMVSVTHDHGAPGLTGTLPIRYRSYIFDQMGKAAAEAVADLKPATASVGSAEVEGLNFVRHYLLANGKYAGDNFGDFTAAAITAHESEADHTARLLRFEREGAKDILVVNFQVHCTATGGMNRTDVSADIAGSIRDTIEAQAEVNCIYMQGACGNINPTSRIAGETLTTDYKAYGKRFWEQAAPALEQMTPVKLGLIKLSGNLRYEGTVDHSRDGQIKAASEIYNNFMKTGDREQSVIDGRPYDIHSCYHAEAIIAKASEGPTLSLELNTIGFGDVAIFTCPYEIFDVNANYVRDNSPYAMTLCMAYCNGHRSYIASAESFKNGSYEADQCRFVPGTGEELAEQYVSMLKELRTQPDSFDKKPELEPTQPGNTDLEGLSWDGRLYYNFDRALYDGTEKSRPRSNTDAGTAFAMTLYNDKGELETVQVVGKSQSLKADGLDIICLWRDAAGLIKGVSGPEEAGLVMEARKYFVQDVNGGKIKLNTAPGFDGQTVTLELSQDQSFLLVPAEGSEKIRTRATKLLVKDRISVVAEEGGKVLAVFVTERVNSEAYNLAKGCKVTTTYEPLYTDSTRTKLTAPIEQAVDGNFSASYGTSAQYKWTADGNIIFDLGAVHTLTGYRIFNYEYPYEWCINEAWTVYGSEDGENWSVLARDGVDVSPFTGPVLYYTNIKGGAPDGSDFDEPVQARYVKLVIDKIFVGAGAAAGSTPEACSRPDVRMYEFQILGN